jgi:hypothetical protein
MINPVDTLIRAEKPYQSKWTPKWLLTVIAYALYGGLGISGYLGLWSPTPIIGEVTGEWYMVMLIGTGLLLWAEYRPIVYRNYNLSYQHVDWDRHWHTYAGRVVIPLPGLTGDPGPNVLLIHYLRTQQVVGIMGLMVTHVATQIHPNYQDVLRKITELTIDLPFTVQTAIHDSPQGNPSQTMTYRIYISAVGARASKNTIENVLDRLRQNLIAFWPILSVNFPHFGFKIMGDTDLFRAIQQPFAANPVRWYTNSEKIHRRRLDRIRRIKGFLFRGIGWFANLAFWYWIWRWEFIWIIGIGILIYDLLINIDKFPSFPGIHPVDLFPATILLRSRRTGAMVLINRIADRVQMLKTYQISQFHPEIPLIPAKFYRAVVGQFLHTPMHWASIFMLRKNDRLINEFSRLTSPIINPLQKLHKTLGIWECHAFFYALYTTTNSAAWLASDARCVDIENAIADRMNPLFTGFLSQTPILDISASGEALFYGIAKTPMGWDHWRRYLPAASITGEHAIPYIQIPDEMHRFTPCYYPGEFSVPQPHDDVIFGRVYNCENHTSEALVGLTRGEIARNVLIGGQSTTEVNDIIRIMIHAMAQQKIPFLVIDAEGSLAKDLRTNYPSLRNFHFGVDLGVRLFDPSPNRPRNAFYSIYLERIFALIGEIWQKTWNSTDLALLKSKVLEFIKSQPKMCDLTVLQTLIQDDGEAKGGTTAKAFLQSLSLDILRISFDTAIEPLLPPSELAGPTPILVDFSLLPAGPFRSLAVEAFLAHFPYFHVPAQGMKVILVKNMTLSVPDIIPELMESGFAWILAPIRLYEFNPALYPYLHSYIMRRLVNPDDVRIGTSLLRLDEGYTNIYSRASRKRSYQREWLMTLKNNHAIVFREQLSLPYVINLEEFIPKSPNRSPTASGHTPTTYLSPPAGASNSVTPPASPPHPFEQLSDISQNVAASHPSPASVDFFAVDFAEPLEFQTILANLFHNLLDFTHQQPDIPKEIISAEIQELFSTYYAIHEPVTEIPRLLENLFRKLHHRGYFEPKSSGADVEAYAISKKAITAMQQILKREKITSQLSVNSDSTAGDEKTGELTDILWELVLFVQDLFPDADHIQSLDLHPELKTRFDALLATYPAAPIPELYQYVESLSPSSQFLTQVEQVLLSFIPGG